MKRKAIICALALAALTSCIKESQDGYGRISFCVADTRITEVTKGNVSDYTSMPSAEGFRLTVTGTNYEWTGLLSEWNKDTKLKIGNYNVSASYGTEGEEGFDKPWFEGNARFAISGSGESTVNIPVSLGNCLVRISCTEAFSEYYPKHSFTVTTLDNEIAFPDTEKRAAFIEAARFSVSGTLTNQDGKSSEMAAKTFSSLSPATCYTVTFDIDNVGGTGITITFDNSTETVSLVNELND